MLKNLPINVLVNLSLAVVFMLFGILAITSQIQLSTIEADSVRLTSLRAPTAKASASMNIALNQSLAALRGWVLIGEEVFIKERSDSWQTIRKEQEILFSLSQGWTNSENVKRLSKIVELLDQLEQEQLNIELIAHKPENIRSWDILLYTAIPLATSLVNDITVMIDFAKNREATPERLTIFSEMADFRGSFALSLADIRAFLLSGDQKFEDSFRHHWGNNEKSYKKLEEWSVHMTAFEKDMLDDIKLVRTEFDPLPKQMFSARKSADWNQASFLLKTTAVLTSNELVLILQEMVRNQNELLEEDAHLLIQKAEEMRLFLLIFLCLSIIITIYFGNVINRKYHMVREELNTRDSLVDQNVLMARYDKDGVVIDISNAFCRKLGGVKHDFVRKNCNFFVLNNEREGFLSEISKSISTGTSWKGEFQRYTEKGEVLWLASTIFPVKNGSKDQGNEFHNILEDITNHKILEEISVTDTLTSLYNRRKFDKIFDHEFKLARRRKVPLALAIIDVDYFKKYNDHYGHPAGDKALVQTASSIRSSLSRPDDYVFRLGGEEFAVIFNDLGKEAALEMLDKIRINIEQLRIEHSQNSVSEYLTISIGAKVSIPDELSDKDVLYNEADSLLYTAKQKRNTVIVG